MKDKCFSNARGCSAPKFTTVPRHAKLPNNATFLLASTRLFNDPELLSIMKLVAIIYSLNGRTSRVLAERAIHFNNPLFRFNVLRFARGTCCV